MITIQTAMFVALGFLTAGLLVLLLMPFYRRRAERLAIAELKRQLPMSEAEIRADKDRLRAEYAIRIHQLETRVEDAGQQGARQRIELNRRDGIINALKTEIASLRSTVDGHENARRVLEQTIADRLPKVEERLAQARQLIDERDQEIVRLMRSADATARAFDETRQINAQQREELKRMSTTLSTRAARNTDKLADPRFDGEVALRSELEAVRARSKEQAELITRLQGLMARGGVGSGDAKGSNGEAAGAASAAIAAGQEQVRESARLKAQLAEAEAALAEARAGTADGGAAESRVAAELRELKQKHAELAAKAASLKAALQVYDASHKDEAAIKDSKVAMKARLVALEAETATRAETIASLRAELSAANERLARQGEHYRDEMRRLAAGTVPASAEPRAAEEDKAQRRPSLAERMAAPRPLAALKAVPAASTVTSGVAEPAAASPEVRDAASAEAGHATVENGVVAAARPQPPPPPPAERGGVVTTSAPALTPANNDKLVEEAAPRRAGLLERISSISKS